MDKPIKKPGMSGGKIALIITVVVICGAGFVLLFGWLFGNWFDKKRASTKSPNDDSETLLQLQQEKRQLQGKLQQLLYKFPCLEMSLSCQKSVGTFAPSTLKPDDKKSSKAVKDAVAAIPDSVKHEYTELKHKIDILTQRIQKLQAKQSKKETKHSIPSETFAQCNLNGDDAKYRIACIQPGRDNRKLELLTHGLGQNIPDSPPAGPYTNSNDAWGWHDGKYCWYYKKDDSTYYIIRWNSMTDGVPGRWEIISAATYDPNSDASKIFYCIDPLQESMNVPPTKLPAGTWKWTGTDATYPLKITISGDGPVAPPTQESCTAKGCCWDKTIDASDFKNYFRLPRKLTQCYYPNVGLVGNGGNHDTSADSFNYIYSDGIDAIRGCKQAGFTNICTKNKQPPTCGYGFTDASEGRGECASGSGDCQIAYWTTPSTSTTSCASSFNQERADDLKPPPPLPLWTAQTLSGGMSPNNLTNAWTNIATQIQQWCGESISVEDGVDGSPPTYNCSNNSDYVEDQQVPSDFAEKLRKMSGRAGVTNPITSLSAADSEAICRNCSIKFVKKRGGDDQLQMTCTEDAPKWWINFGNYYNESVGTETPLKNVFDRCGIAGAYCCNRAGKGMGMASIITNDGNVEDSKDAMAAASTKPPLDICPDTHPYPFDSNKSCCKKLPPAPDSQVCVHGTPTLQSSGALVCTMSNSNSCPGGDEVQCPNPPCVQAQPPTFDAQIKFGNNNLCSPSSDDFAVGNLTSDQTCDFFFGADGNKMTPNSASRLIGKYLYFSGTNWWAKIVSIAPSDRPDPVVAYDGECNRHECTGKGYIDSSGRGVDSVNFPEGYVRENANARSPPPPGGRYIDSSGRGVDSVNSLEGYVRENARAFPPPPGARRPRILDSNDNTILMQPSGCSCILNLRLVTQDEATAAGIGTLGDYNPDSGPVYVKETLDPSSPDVSAPNITAAQLTWNLFAKKEADGWHKYVGDKPGQPPKFAATSTATPTFSYQHDRVRFMPIGSTGT